MDSASKDVGSAQQSQGAPDIKFSGPVGASSGSALGSNPAGTPQSHHKMKGLYGGIFRPTKSCADLEQMHGTSGTSTPVDGSNNSLNIVGTPPLVCSAPSSTTGLTRYGGMFRSHRSCANLELMGEASAKPSDHSTQVDQQSGLLFGSLKSYFGKSNMVSPRDLNVMAPLSS